MNTSPRLVATAIGLTFFLPSCETSEQKALREKRETYQVANRMQTQHREDLRQLSKRIAELEAKNEALNEQVNAEPPAMPEEAVQEATPPPAVEAVAEDDDDENDLAARDRRKIQRYQNSGLSGIPAEISEQILRKARRDTRSWAALEQIEAQREGYRAMEAFAAEDGPMLRKDRDELIFALKREYPGDWAGMAQELHRQTDAWGVMEEWKAKGVPGLERWESDTVLNEATGAYPYDWSSALKAVADAARTEVANRRTASAEAGD